MNSMLFVVLFLSHKYILCDLFALKEEQNTAYETAKGKEIQKGMHIDVEVC